MAAEREAAKCGACYGPTNPSPAEQAASGVRRIVELVELRPEHEAEYRRLHADVWPEVVAAVRRANIRNYSIHLVELGGKKCLVRYLEYVGTDYEGDCATIGQDPTTRDRWWPVTDSHQVRIEGTPAGAQWLPAEMVMHLA